MAGRRLRIVALTVAVLGIAVAAYLTYVHYAGLEPFCAGGGGGGCERVQSSTYAMLGGIPVAMLGLGGYVSFPWLSSYRARQRDSLRRSSRSSGSALARTSRTSSCS